MSQARSGSPVGLSQITVDSYHLPFVAPVTLAIRPIYPGKRYLDWELPDPSGLPVEEVP